MRLYVSDVIYKGNTVEDRGGVDTVKAQGGRNTVGDRGRGLGIGRLDGDPVRLEKWLLVRSFCKLLGNFGKNPPTQ